MKSNHILFYATCLSLLFLFNGCEENSELLGEADAGWKPIEFPSCRAQLGVSGATRASGLTEIKTGTLGLYRKATNGYTELNNVRYTYKEATTETAAGWESDDATNAIYVNAKTADIYAVYPYMEIGGAPTNGHKFDGTNVTGMHQQRYYSDSPQRGDDQWRQPCQQPCTKTGTSYEAHLFAIDFAYKKCLFRRLCHQIGDT